MTKLVICSPQLGLAPNSIMGGEVFDREILVGLAKRGVKIEIILPKNKPHDAKVKNWHLTYLPVSHFPAILGSFLYLPYLLKMYKQNEFQVLRIHQPQFLGIAAIIFKIFHPKVQLLATYHQARETNFFMFSKFINNYWDHIITDSENVKQIILQKFSVDPDKITVVKNGVPSYLTPKKADEKLKRKLGLGGKFILLFMGIFVERKNPIFLLKVLRQVLKASPNVALLYWGEGPLEKEIKKIAKDFGISKNIKFIKPLYGPAKNKIHNLADVFVHPSIDEGFALAPLEAMACAKPVIMNNMHSAKEAVEESKNGFLCPPNSVKVWSEKILKLLNDRKLKEKLSKNSYEKAKRDFNWNKSIRTHLEVISYLTKRN